MVEPLRVVVAMSVWLNDVRVHGDAQVAAAERENQRLTAQEVLERLGDEWNALGMCSFSGDGSGGWRADLNQDDIKQIRELLREAAATIEAYS